jgi:phosphoribosylamine--glycine ligase
MQQHDIPTADFAIFHEREAAEQLLSETRTPAPYVVKTDSPTTDEDVIVCEDAATAQATVSRLMAENGPGKAENAVVIEEYLQGRSLTVVAFSDGRILSPLPPTRVYKHVHENDQGPFTRGMGAYTPALDVEAASLQEITTRILEPAVAGIVQEDSPLTGVLRASLIVTADGPKTLALNCHFGDPEAQVILPMLQADVADVMMACVERQLGPKQIQTRSGACATVVLTASGYPNRYQTGTAVTGLADAGATERVTVFHMDTQPQDGKVVTDGGRVLAVSALGQDLETAVRRTYEAAEKIQFEGVHYRSDIGGKA